VAWCEIVVAVDTFAHAESGLEKALWTDCDLEHLGFHDAQVVAMAVTESGEPGRSRVLFDLDYLVRWVHPVAPETNFSFWVAPVTLVFEDVWALSGELAHADLGIDRIGRLPEGPGPGWHVDGHTFDLHLTSWAGFTMTVRRSPILVHRQRLTLAQRGGVSFGETPFATER